jgi:hypothetical protein
MRRTILDCYTDEPAGLGVPPFIGVWPRYVAGQYDHEPTYLTIDDIRLVRYVEHVPEVVIDPPRGRTHLEVLNHTRSYEEIRRVLENTDELIIIVGVQTPGKYLSARPGTLHEVEKLLRSFQEGDRRQDRSMGVPPMDSESRAGCPCHGDSIRKILTGPVLTGGTQARGGARPQVADAEYFDELRPLAFDT